MEAIYFDKFGNQVSEINVGTTNLSGAFLNGEEYVYSETTSDAPVEFSENFVHDCWADVREDNNISMFIDPNSKVFSINLRTSEDSDDNEKFITFSLCDEKYDQFIQFIKNSVK